MAFGFSGQQEVKDGISEPVDAEVRILSWTSEPGDALRETKVSRFDEYIVEAQVPPVVPDPIKVRGIGSTTLYVDLDIVCSFRISRSLIDSRFGLSSRFDDDFPSSLTGKVNCISIDHYVCGFIYKRKLKTIQ